MVVFLHPTTISYPEQRYIGFAVKVYVAIFVASGTLFELVAGADELQDVINNTPNLMLKAKISILACFINLDFVMVY